MNIYMKQAKTNAERGMLNNEGGPFGAVIIDKQGNIISNGNNRVLIDKDPTSHAEIIAIRRACQKLHTIDLSDYILYTSCEPCPMCLSAIMWSNIKTVYYACNRLDASNIGFRDNDIYEYIKGNNQMLSLNQIDREECLDIMKKYKEQNRDIY